MHGKNPVRGVYRGAGDASTKLQVHKVFDTIQGEGPFSGRRAVFVRLSGCQLRCSWCDTAWDDEKDSYRTSHDIAHEAKTICSSKELVIITGGEPLRQPVMPLIYAL